MKKPGKKKKMVLAVCIVIVLALVVWIVVDNNTVGTTFYSLSSAKITQKMRIVHISDLHGMEYGKNNVRLVELIKEQAPDLIAMTGDMAKDVPGNNADIAAFFNACASIAPTYYIPGNHEYIFSNGADFRENYVPATNVKVLINAVDTVSINGNTVNVIGFDETADTFNGIINTGTEGFNLLLDHYPENFAQSNRYCDLNIDLMLAGHMHGGQVRIPIFNIPVFSPLSNNGKRALFPEYAQGMHRENDSTLIVSRGLGGSVPIRICDQPELVVIDLLPQ